MATPSGLTILGRVGAAVGIKGWVRLISFTDPAGNLLEFRHFYLSAPGGYLSAPGGYLSAPGESGDKPAGPLEAIEIDAGRFQGKQLIGHIRGCDDRDEARQYTGRDLLVETSALPALAEDEFYWHQLEGLLVVNLQEERLGRVHHLMETGANDVLVVRPDADSIDTEERLIPWLRESVVKEVDLEGRTIRVDWEKDY